MSEQDQNIEQLFRETFENFESDVSPGVWEKVQSQIGSGGSPASDGGASSSGASVVTGVTSGIVKIAAVVGIAGSLAVGGYWLSRSTGDKEPVAAEMQTEQLEQMQPEESQKSELQPEISAQQSEPVTTVPGEREKETVAKDETVAPATSPEPAVRNTPSSSAKTTTGAPSQKESASSPVAAANSEPSAKEPGQTVAEPAGAITPDEERKPVKKNTAEATANQPIAAITASVTEGRIPLEVRFSSHTVLAEQILWDFGDGTPTSGVAHPRHTFEKAGDYAVVLTVRGTNGLTVSDTMQISVTAGAAVFIPNVITPNGDNVNDFFKVEAETSAIKQFHCLITDRSGTPLYEMNNINQSWDGKDRMGNDVNDGVYFYIIRYTTVDDHSDIKKGVLTLKR